MLPIVNKTRIFSDLLDSFAQSQKEFSLQELATRFSFDVIGILVLDVDLVCDGIYCFQDAIGPRWVCETQ
jgi:hypothetical protein